MGRRGRKKQLEVEARSWHLLASGIGTVAACRLVGVTRRTGYRWRAELGGLVPVRLGEAVGSNRYLSMVERQRIAVLHGQGVGVGEVARRPDRSPSTVSRGLLRNALAHDKGICAALLAHARARARGARPGRSRLARDGELRAVVQDTLELEQGPEQIAAHLVGVFPDRPDRQLCHEAIYQARYRGARGGLHRELTRRLRTGRPLRKRRRSAAERRSRVVLPHQGIEQRPAIAWERSRLGDWYGDLVVGPMSRSAVATPVDRRSR